MVNEQKMKLREVEQVCQRLTEQRDEAIRQVDALQTSRLKAYEELQAARAEAVALAAQLHETRALLAEVWEAATNDAVPFFERLPALRQLVPRLAALLPARENKEE
jgi:chromosome segregation ATPase